MSFEIAEALYPLDALRPGELGDLGVALLADALDALDAERSGPAHHAW
jgi:hypothetical protein